MRILFNLYHMVPTPEVEDAKDNGKAGRNSSFQCADYGARENTNRQVSI